MEKGSKLKAFFNKNVDYFIVFVVAVISVVIQLTNTMVPLELRMYDAMLHFQKPIEQSDLVTFIDIDDTSLSELGTWPWTRDIEAEILMSLKEYGARAAIFDIEFLSPSSKTADENIYEITQNAFENGEREIASSVYGFASGVETGSVNRQNAKAKASGLVNNEIDESIYKMWQEISDNLNKDNDDLFARAVQFFGLASLTFNTRNIKINTSKADLDYADKRHLYSNIIDEDGYTERNNRRIAAEQKQEIKLTPALHSILNHAYSAGFTNVVIDEDGTRRRNELLFKGESGKYALQLAFSPLVHILDVQSIERKKNRIILHGALYPGETERRDVKIPLDKRGCMVINWMHESYGDSFKHVTAVNVYGMTLLEKDLCRYLKEIAEMDKSALPESDAEFLDYAKDLLLEYDEILGVKKALLARCNGYDENGNAIGGGLTDSDYETYFDMRKEWRETMINYVESVFQNIESAVKIPSLISLANGLTDYETQWAENVENVNGSICLIGNSATASTDLGVTPYEERYANLGTHGNIINTLLQRDFIACAPEWAGLFLVLVTAVLVIVMFRSLTTVKKNIYGLIYVVGPVAFLVVLMVAFRIYTPVVLPFITSLIIFIAEFVLNFVSTSKEKSFIQQKFGAYVAPEVVNEIIKNPSYANIGGESKELTALFSDVKTFSGFTECINNEEEAKGKSGAERLVRILNQYLGVLSDAIMEQRGTIDKYVGDEIVSFFGAPIDNPNHAFDACLAGIRMLNAEKIYNEEHLSELPINPRTGEPFLLRSRVGLNTGDMVVGNMGTDKKLNFTVMGNNVNLASRLEGTNKAYNSWIMCSESTWNSANRGEHEGLIVARALDCVKVVNVEKPVRIYSILGLRNELEKERLEAAEIFNEGMKWYLKGADVPGGGEKDPDDFRKAFDLFVQAKNCAPADESSDVFIMRCANFLASLDKSFYKSLPNEFLIKNLGSLQPVDIPHRWDGVFTMETK